MKKYLFGALLALLLQSAQAAPIGWYQLTANWGASQFSGQFYYDEASPYAVTQVSGTLEDAFQTTAITTVWNIVNAAPAEDPLFLHNTKPSAEFGYDAGFYLALRDLGATLAIDSTRENSLYDWSDFAAFEQGELNGVALTGWTIAQVQDVPEPGSLALLGVGLLGCVLGRRTQR